METVSFVEKAVGRKPAGGTLVAKKERAEVVTPFCPEQSYRNRRIFKTASGYFPR